MNSESSYIASWLTGLMQICPELSTSFRVSLNLRVFQKLLTLLLCGGITLILEQALLWRMISEIKTTQIAHCAKKDSFARPPRQGHYSV